MPKKIKSLGIDVITGSTSTCDGGSPRVLIDSLSPFGDLGSQFSRIRSLSNCDTELDLAVVAFPAHLGLFERKRLHSNHSSMLNARGGRILCRASAASLAFLDLDHQVEETVILSLLEAGHCEIAVVEYETGSVEIIAISSSRFLHRKSDRRRISEIAIRCGIPAADAERVSSDDALWYRISTDDPSVPSLVENSKLNLEPLIHSSTLREELTRMAEEYELNCRRAINCMRAIKLGGNLGAPTWPDTRLVCLGDQKILAGFASELETEFQKSPIYLGPAGGFISAGAAIMAAIMAGQIRNIVLLDAIHTYLSLKAFGGAGSKVQVALQMIPRGSTLPLCVRETIQAVQPNQTHADVRLFESPRPCFVYEEDIDTELCVARITGLQGEDKLPPMLEVTVDIDLNADIALQVKDIKTGKSVAVTLVTDEHSLPPEDDSAQITCCEEEDHDDTPDE